MTLTKDLIIDSIRKNCSLVKTQSAEMFETLLEIITSTLESGEDVLVSGFGKFCIKDKNERRGRNPQTGSDLMLDARRVVIFRCSPVLREKINGKG